MNKLKIKSIPPKEAQEKGSQLENFPTLAAAVVGVRVRKRGKLWSQIVVRGVVWVGVRAWQWN